jgi:hypothetical protein
MNQFRLNEACEALGIVNASVELDGVIWTGADDNRTYLTENQIKSVQQKAKELQAERATARQAVLDRLGITADEAALLLG